MIAATGFLASVLEAFARRDLTTAAAGFAEHAVYREARKPAVRGKASVAEHFARFAASGAAWSFHVDDVIADADRACVVYRFAMPGGNGEAWAERAGCALVRLDERGQIAEWREYEG
ncbi:MAG: nuclear transport factor 2 family protein [Candidatus Eremiobacteraeota bacterium]|nr:nuclear transport factor 2 family protein [Candidatus Eremiobacteraeota bacterium]